MLRVKKRQKKEKVWFRSTEYKVLSVKLGLFFFRAVATINMIILPLLGKICWYQKIKTKQNII